MTDDQLRADVRASIAALRADVRRAVDDIRQHAEAAREAAQAERHRAHDGWDSSHVEERMSELAGWVRDGTFQRAATEAGRAFLSAFRGPARDAGSDQSPGDWV